MCGRFTLKTPAEEFVEQFGNLTVEYAPKPRYNIAPTQPVATLLNDGRNAVVATRWGLIPSWSKDPAIGSRMINARAETLLEKPSFKTNLRRRRCLILADGFYEWQAVPGRTRKVPYYIRLKSGKPFAFAGLWDAWKDPKGQEVSTSTIITTSPNELVAPIHNRMPVILQPDHYEAWLDPRDVDPESLLSKLTPYPGPDMETYPVSDKVNRPSVDDPSCIEPSAHPG